jgi:hypothetical protein
VFRLGSPAFVSVPAAVPGMAELFDADLAQDTIARVTHGYLGEASERPHEELPTDEDQYIKRVDGALSPSFSTDGDVLAFSSTAANLVYGDGNSPGLTSELDGSDAFVVNRVTFESTAIPQSISEAPPNPSLAPAWRLGVTALSLGDGNVMLYVEVPGAGRLSAQASGPVPVSYGRTSHARSRAGRHATPTDHRTTVMSRVVASAATGSEEAAGSLRTLLLKPESKYRSLTSQADGFSAKVTLTFAAAGHPLLHTTITASFRSPVVKLAKRSKTSRKRRRGGRT